MVQTLQSTALPTPKGVTMKTFMLLTAILVFAGCGERKGTASGADTSGMAPAMSDSMGMMHSDSTMARDTAKK